MNQKNEISPVSNNESILTLMKNSEILKREDLEVLAASKEFIVSCFNDVPMYRPLPVKLFGVLNDKDFPTAESKYWQCKVEAEVHGEQLIDNIHNMELMLLTLEKSDYMIEELESRYSTEPDQRAKKEMEFDIREQKIHRSKIQFKLFRLQKQIKYRIEEVKEWKKITDKIAANGKIDGSTYVKQYINTMKRKMSDSAKAESDEDKKKDLEKQLAVFDSISRQIEGF